MIQATSFPINVTYAEKVSRQYAAAGDALSGNPGMAVVDTVTSDSAKNAELEAIVNNNPELRNSIVAAQNAAYLGRVGDAVSQAQSAMNANPAKADYYNSWLKSAVQRITGMGFTFDFSDGKLNGSFISNGQKIGLMENLEKLTV